MDLRECKAGDEVQWFQSSAKGSTMKGSYYPAVIARVKKQRVAILLKAPTGESLLKIVDPINLVRPKKLE